MFTTPIPIAILATAILSTGVILGYLTAVPTIRDQRRYLGAAAWQLTHDPLTGLLNRTGLHDAYTAAHTQPITVMLLDLDRFKNVNDTLGHEGGDHILATIASRLGQLATARGGVAARLAGDEFAALLPTNTELGTLATALLTAITEPVLIDTDNGPYAITVTASLGTAETTGPGTPASTALRHADIAMYHAKHHGGNRHQPYTPGMTMPPHTGRRGPRLRDHTRKTNGVSA